MIKVQRKKRTRQSGEDNLQDTEFFLSIHPPTISLINSFLLPLMMPRPCTLSATFGQAFPNARVNINSTPGHLEPNKSPIWMYFHHENSIMAALFSQSPTTGNLESSLSSSSPNKDSNAFLAWRRGPSCTSVGGMLWLWTPTWDSPSCWWHLHTMTQTQAGHNPSK